MGKTFEVKGAKRINGKECRHFSNEPGNQEKHRCSVLRFVTWSDYGISEERLNELKFICRSGKYDSLIRRAAYRTDETAAEFLIKSATKNLSYNKIEFDFTLGRVPIGRTDFYAIRRLFYYYLNCMLEEKQIDKRN